MRLLISYIMVTRIGHRGAAGYAPENTLSSIKKAVSLNCDYTELDVHLCGSGDLVVIHDETVDRTTNGSGMVSKMSLKELKLLKICNEEEIPTLEEVMNHLRGIIKLNIELKGLGTAQRVFELVKSTGWSNEDLMITSFNWDMLKEYKELDSEAVIGPLTYFNLPEAFTMAERLNAQCINPYHKNLDQEYLIEAHDKGLKIYPWTVNELEDIEQLIILGVDGIISDYPDKVLSK